MNFFPFCRFLALLLRSLGFLLHFGKLIFWDLLPVSWGITNFSNALLHTPEKIFLLFHPTCARFFNGFSSYIFQLVVCAFREKLKTDFSLSLLLFLYFARLPLSSLRKSFILLVEILQLFLSFLFLFGESLDRWFSWPCRALQLPASKFISLSCERKTAQK